MFDTETQTFTPVKLDTPALLHGINYKSVDGKKGQVLAVNHLLNGSVVDLYDFDIPSRKMKLQKRFSHELITTPNDVIFYGDGFFVTNDHQFGRGVARMFEEYLQLPLGINFVIFSNYYRKPLVLLIQDW